jgi:hypothetical protein
MLLKNILGEPQNYLSIILGDSANVREVLTPFPLFLRGLLTQKKGKYSRRTILGDSTNLREALVFNASILKLAV